MRTKLGLLFSALIVMTPLSVFAADTIYEGEVTVATEAFVALTPVGTPVGGTIGIDDAALASGTVGVADIVSIDVNVGGFCFAIAPGDCGGVGSLVPIESIDNAAITGSAGVLGGNFSVTAFSPTFMVSIPIAFDLDAGTFAADGGALGIVSGTGVLATPTSELIYGGVVTVATGAFEALTPVGTATGGPIVVNSEALSAGSIGVSDIASIDVNVGGFCFATGTGDCGGVGTIVPITSIDSAAITGTSGVLGGSFAVTAFSPTFMVSIPISFDLDAQTFFADGDALGTVSGTGALEAPDADGDGVLDGVDNCTMVANPDQIDTNADGIGNRCDADIDNNCTINFIDISQFTPKFNSSVGNPLYDEDFDIDSSGALNFVDYIAYTSAFGGPPGPSANECVPGLGN